MAVSYTHLDVYKRQPRDIPIRYENVVTKIVGEIFGLHCEQIERQNAAVFPSEPCPIVKGRGSSKPFQIARHLTLAVQNERFQFRVWDLIQLFIFEKRRRIRWADPQLEIKLNVGVFSDHKGGPSRPTETHVTDKHRIGSGLKAHRIGSIRTSS